jgi:hypothetical protein
MLLRLRKVPDKSCRENQNTHFVSNKLKIQCIRENTGAQNIVKEIKQYQEKWLQHVQRMDTNRIPKQALLYKSKGRRHIGRPRKRRRGQFHFEDQGTGNTPNPSWTWWWWWCFSENLAVYEIMWKNIVQTDRPQMAIWRTRIACWIPKATNKHSLFFHYNNGCTNAPRCYVMRTFPVLFNISAGRSRIWRVL